MGDSDGYCVRLDPITGLELSMVLLRDVKNSKSLKEKVMSGSLQCAIINPALIVDPFQVAVAANRAAVSLSAGTMVTKSVYTELLYNLSISKNITQSLIKFGINEKDQDILLATINKPGDSGIDRILSEVDGKTVLFSHLQDICDKKILCKSYKISETESKVSPLLDSIVSRIATSEFVSH